MFEKKVRGIDIMIDYSNIEDFMLHSFDNSWVGSSFVAFCEHCGIIRYYDLPLDFYLVKKEYHDLLFCKKCWEEIESEHAKRKREIRLKFETVKYYCYEEIIRKKESQDLE